MVAAQQRLSNLIRLAAAPRPNARRTRSQRGIHRPRTRRSSEYALTSLSVQQGRGVLVRTPQPLLQHGSAGATERQQRQIASWAIFSTDPFARWRAHKQFVYRLPMRPQLMFL